MLYVHFSSRREPPQVPTRVVHWGSAGTPPGVYVYPMSATTMPYAADRAYKFFLESLVEPVNTRTYTKAELERDLAALAALDVDVPGIQRRWLKYKDNFRANELPFSSLWYTVTHAQRELDPEDPPSWGASGVADPTYARDLLIALDHKAIDDRLGILWSSEPQQSVFFSNDAFRVVGLEVR